MGMLETLLPRDSGEKNLLLLLQLPYNPLRPPLPFFSYFRLLITFSFDGDPHLVFSARFKCEHLHLVNHSPAVTFI